MKVSKKAVNVAGAEWSRLVSLYGENALNTQRAFIRYMELKTAWEKQTGQTFGELRRKNPRKNKRARNPGEPVAKQAREYAEWVKQAGHAIRQGRSLVSFVFAAHPSHRALARRAYREAAVKMIPRNPVPALRQGRREELLRAAATLYNDFSGHNEFEVHKVSVPDFPRELAVIGELAGVMYDTVRDGRKEQYVHQFSRKGGRPLLCVSPDGKQLMIVGGNYRFTDRGIVG